MRRYRSIEFVISFVLSNKIKSANVFGLSYLRKYNTLQINLLFKTSQGELNCYFLNLYILESRLQG